MDREQTGGGAAQGRLGVLVGSADESPRMGRHLAFCRNETRFIGRVDHCPTEVRLRPRSARPGSANPGLSSPSASMPSSR
jgi:hypothetical protein